MTVILVEGESDRAAVEIVASRLGVRLPPVATVNGAGGARAAAAAYQDQTLIGLVDANEQREFDGVVEKVFVCDPDLEGELVRALGIDAVLAVIASQGELTSFRRLQNQPAQRGKPTAAQLRRFFAGRSGNKLRYARLLASAIPRDRLPAPLAGLVLAAGREGVESYPHVMVDRMSKPELHIDTVAEWDAWLDADPDPNGIRLRLRRKASTRAGITYAEALDVALCFGWIDGQSQSLNDDYYLQTFTPRRPRSLWSKVNIGHATRLIEEGRMRPQGQLEVDLAKADGRWDRAYRQRDGELPIELQEALDADPELASAFASQSAQNRFAMAFRVANLKRPESRTARVAQYAEMLRRGETLH